MFPVLVVFVAYLLGSIPFGYLIVRAKHGGDVRTSGSGGTGATNVSRRAGKVAGVITLICDALKGFLAVFFARVLAGSDVSGSWMVAMAAIAAIVGHCFPVWLRFKGGKGVATGVGVFLALCPPALGCALLIFVPVFWFSRYVSLASISSALAFPIFVTFFNFIGSCPLDRVPLLAASVAGAILVVVMHRGNISRLIAGKETRFE
jgi:acyl phosphate:glycerol-3-phosphate acyltransferase